MPISHISLATGPARFAVMRAFYLEALKPLGYVPYFDNEGFGTLGLKPRDGPPDFGNGEQPDAFASAGRGEGGEVEVVDVETRPGRTHVAFDAEGPEVVDRWFDGAVFLRLSRSDRWW